MLFSVCRAPLRSMIFCAFYDHAVFCVQSTIEFYDFLCVSRSCCFLCAEHHCVLWFSVRSKIELFYVCWKPMRSMIFCVLHDSVLSCVQKTLNVLTLSVNFKINWIYVLLVVLFKHSNFYDCFRENRALEKIKRMGLEANSRNCSFKNTSDGKMTPRRKKRTWKRG